MRSIIAHGHIFKNAGTTFDWSLQRNFGAGFLDHRDDKRMRERRADHVQELVQERPDLRALSSHFLCRPLPVMEDVHFEPVYFLRHPLERIASVYDFERRQEADTPGARAAKEMGFRDYAAWRMQAHVSRTIRDYQTCNLAGKHENELLREVNFRTLKGAMDNLWGMRCVGVVDRYDESMVAFEHVLRENFPEIDLAYVRQNAGAGKWSRGSLEEKIEKILHELGPLQAEVLANNSFDLAIYRFANQKLDEAIAELPDFDARLAGFRERCQHLGGQVGGQAETKPLRRSLHRQPPQAAAAAPEQAGSTGARRSVLLHAHMFKNAGTTFDWSLQRSLGEGFMDHRDDDAMRAGAGYLEGFLREHPRLRALSSHWIGFPLPEAEELDLQLALFLRDPIERIRSVYNFERRQEPATTPGSKKAKELGFLDYVRWQLQPMPGPVVKNFHTRYCSGDYLGQDLEELYDRATKTLDSTPLLGLVHRYDESMVLFEHLLRDSFPRLDLAYRRQNSSEGVALEREQGRLAVEAELEPVMEEVLAANAWDLRLMQRAEARFEQLLAEVPNLDQRLQALRERNEALP